MARRATGAPKKKPARPLNVAERLPSDDQELYNHCEAGWTAMQADTAHFASPPFGPAMDAALTGLSKALAAAPNGGPVEKEAVKTAATTLRGVWHQYAKYAQSVLRTLPVEATPPILVNLMLYKSNAGAHKPKPPLAAKQGTPSGTVKLVALAILDALTYGFEWSTDQVNWSTQTTGKTRLTVAGLTPGKTYWFRVRAFLRDGTTTDYVHTVNLMVI
jgi:hypothetical protein